MKFKDLVTKGKSDLQNLADEEGVNYSSTTKRTELIKKICSNLSDYHKDLLELNAKQVKKVAEESDVEYTTKKKTLAKLSQLDEENQNEQEDRGSWREELDDAIDLAIKNSLSKKMKYNIYDKVDDPVDNLFNVAPAYIKRPKDAELVMSINITEYAKDNL